MDSEQHSEQKWYTSENMFFSTRGWHMEFRDASTAKDFYDRILYFSGWGKRKPERQPVMLEGTQVVFKLSRRKGKKTETATPG